MALLLSLLACSCIAVASAGSFYQDFDITWGGGHAKILNNGELLHSLPRPNLWLRLLSPRTNISLEGRHAAKSSPANSAGTITAYYLSSQGPTHDEIDFGFLGNLSGDPYTLHTNVFTQGKGNRKQHFHLWFDPTKEFHTHSILWNPRHVIFSVDGIPIRDFKNLESKEIRFPKNQPMRHYSSLWDAEDWAVRGGLVMTDEAPFAASYKSFRADACVWSTHGGSSCAATKSPSNSLNNAWLNQDLDSTRQERMRWVQKNHMIYNYRTDMKRFPQGLPPECNIA